jgi:hypothetical protein
MQKDTGILVSLNLQATRPADAPRAGDPA